MTEHKAIRFLSIVLAVLMSVSLLFLSVSAETPESEADVSDLTTLILIGDMNLDGEIGMKDVWAIRWFISSKIDSKGVLHKVSDAWQKWLDEHGNPDFSPALIAGDVNGSRSVDMKDVLILRQYIAGVTPSYDSLLV